MMEKLIGYTLLVASLAVLVFCGMNVDRVMRGKEKPITPFAFSGISMNPSQFLGANVPEQLREQLAQSPSMPLVSADMLNDTSNLAAHLVLMGFLATIAFRVGSLGVMLIRPIVVPVRWKKSEEDHKTVSE